MEHVDVIDVVHDNDNVLLKSGSERTRERESYNSGTGRKRR